MTSFPSDSRPAVASARARSRCTAWFFGLCLLLAGGFAQAAGCLPQSITVASGGTVVTDLSNCTVSGINGYQSPPMHGVNDSRNNNSTGLVYYTNNGDGSTTDSFSVIDGDDNSVIPFSVTVIQSNPTVTTTTLPDPTVGAAYSQSLAASGGTTPYGWSLTGGALPAGLTLSSAGVVSGTPTQAGSFNPVFTVTDSGNRTGSRSIALNVAAPTLAIAPATLPNGVVGTAYSRALATTGGTAPYTYAVSGGSLPPGLTVSSTGTVSGTPSAAGNYSFTVRSTDSSTGTGAPFSATRTYAFTVDAPTIVVAPATLPNPTVGAAYSQTVTASGGAAPYTFAVTAGALSAGLTLGSSGVVGGTPTAAGTFNFTVTATDNGGFTGSRAYTVTVGAPTIAIAPATLPAATAGQAYSATVSAGGGTSPYSYAVTAGSLPPGITLSAAGVVSGTSPVAGNFTFTVTATDSSTGAGAPFSGSRAYTLTIAAPTVVVAPATLPNPVVGVAYSQNVVASGGTAPYSFAVTAGALPSGMFLSSTGVLSGTPTAGGTFNFTVTATDGNGFTGSRAYTVTVGAPTIVVTPASVSNAVVAQPYSASFTAGGGTAPYSFTVVAGSLPPGTTFSPSGVLAGTPVSPGSFSFTVGATDSSSGAGAPYVGTRAYTLTVAAPAVVVAPTSLPSPTVGTSYAQAVTASGGTAPYTFAVTAGALPPGLTLGATGGLGGTPTAAGTFNVTITATDAYGFTGARAYTLTVGGPTLVLTPTSQPTAHVGQVYAASFSTTGGIAPYHYTVTGSLPPGLALADNGTLAGTPTRAGSFPVVIRVADSSTGAGSPFTTTVNVTLVVDADPLLLMPTSPALTATYGASTAIAFTSSGGSAPRTLTLTGPLPAGMTFDAAAGMLSGTPTVTGSFPFTVTVTDASATPATTNRTYTLTIAAISVTVTPATLPGGIVGSAYSASLNAAGGAAPYTFAVSAGSVPDGVALSAAGALVGTPTRSGPFAFTVRATDAHGMTGTQAYSVTIGDAAPVAVADVATTAANQPVVIAVAANDSGPITSLAVAATPSHGAVVVDGTSVRYAPATDFFGTDSFTYTAVGPGGRSNAASVTVTVQSGALPVVPDRSVTALAGASVTIDAAGGASGGPFTAVTLVTPPADGTTTVSNTSIAYTAPPDSAGPQRFTYTLSNAFGASPPATVTVTVQPRPVAVALTATVGAAQSVQVDLTGAARGGPFTDAALVSLSPTQAGSARIVKTATGYRLDFAAAAAFSGPAQLVYTLTNAYATSQPATVTITVTARPDPSKDAEVTGILGAQVEATRRMATGQIANFQQRLESLHGATNARVTNGLTFGSGDARRTSDAVRPEADGGVDVRARDVAGRNAAPPAVEGGTSSDEIGFWTGGAVNFGVRDRGETASGANFTTTGVSVGADKRLSSALTLGLGVGYGHDASDIGNLGSRSTSTAYNVAVYGSLRPTDSTYVDTLVGYQWIDFDARRYVTGDGSRVTGSRGGQQSFASIAVGYEHDDGTTRITPYGRLDVARARLKGYTERGDTTDALDYRDQTVNTSAGAVGLRTEVRIVRDFGLLIPRVRIEYQRDFQGSSEAVMRYADLPAGPLYRANFVDTARNHTSLGVGLQAAFHGGLMLRIEYQALFDAATHANQSVQLGLEKRF